LNFILNVLNFTTMVYRSCAASWASLPMGCLCRCACTHTQSHRRTRRHSGRHTKNNTCLIQ